MRCTAKGSLVGACDEHGLEHEPVSCVQANDLLPVLQGLAGELVCIKHFTLLRQDEKRMKRVARAILSGGWRLNKSEEQAFDRFGGYKMQLAAHTDDIWRRWGRGRQQDRTIHYNHTTLCECSGPDWRLVYVCGDMAPAALLETLLTVPGIDQDHASMQGSAVLDVWRKEYSQVEAGYYLIKQVMNESELASLKNCERADAGPVLEAMISHLFIVGCAFDNPLSIDAVNTFSHAARLQGTSKTVSFGGFQSHMATQNQKDRRWRFRISIFDLEPDSLRYVKAVVYRKWDF